MNKGSSQLITKVRVRDITVGGDRLAVAAGPCVLESYEGAYAIAEEMKKLCGEFGFGYIFKASFDKANRTSIASYRGPGIEEGLEWLKDIRDRLDVPVVTDMHEPWQAERLAEAVDLLQIPALVSSFDLAINEQCHAYQECQLLTPFVQAGKPVLNIEYDERFMVDASSQQQLCDEAAQLGLQTQVLTPTLDGTVRLRCF